LKNKRQMSAIGRSWVFRFGPFPSKCCSFQLHLAGKTAKAKEDLARLAKIRAARDEAEAKRDASTKGVTF
jgi:hypothetical protein